MTPIPDASIDDHNRFVENTGVGTLLLIVLSVAAGVATYWLPLADDVSQAASFLFDFHLVMLVLIGIDGFSLAQSDRRSRERDRRFVRIALPLGAVASAVALALLFVIRGYETPEALEHVLWQVTVAVSAGVLVLAVALLIENIRGRSAQEVLDRTGGTPDEGTEAGGS